MLLAIPLALAGSGSSLGAALRCCANPNPNSGGEEIRPMSPGLARQLRHKNEARHRRLEELRRSFAAGGGGSATGGSDAGDGGSGVGKECAGLAALGDPYDAALFPEEHAAFKRAHNEALAVLARWCWRQQLLMDGDPHHHNDGDGSSDDGGGGGAAPAVFYLDGPDGGTTSHLLHHSDFAPAQLHVANEWADTVAALRSDPHRLPPANCVLGRAQDVLVQDFADVDYFAAYYLDGCGGRAEPVLEMVDSIFRRPSMPRATAMATATAKSPSRTFAIGFTLTQAEPGGRDLIDRVQDVTRGILARSRAVGYDMRHVGDEPERYCVDPGLRRKHDGTCTSWVVCSPASNSSY